MPAFKNHNATPQVPFTPGPGSVQGFTPNIPIFEERNFIISGVTRDATGAALGNCIVMLFNQATKALEQTVTSDASGNYSFTVDKTASYFDVAYKAGSPDVFGTTANTLTGA